MRIIIGLIILLLSGQSVNAQSVKGEVRDENGEEVIGANVIIKGTQIGETTDYEGKFVLKIGSISPPFTLQISFIGYKTLEKIVTNPSEYLKIQMEVDQEMLAEVDIIEKRLSDKQRESALTVEAMDALAIKETPAVSFYEGLGNLKGVDLTSASIGFKVLNTRGFNSTSPVRSLQVIDGVDNQAPGLNFSLGNFLGASELDISNVDIIAGASTAFYGPSAFNGVISMTTKNPFIYQGLTASVKVGERALTETAVRYAQSYKIFNSETDNFAYKINLYYLRADDWEAENYQPVDDSPIPADNPGRYDAINVYGDEDLSSNNDYTSYESFQFGDFAGLGKFFRPGYREVDIVDYDTRNLKTNLGLYYRITPEVELSYNFNYGTGTTVYQGENRFSLKDIQFFQNVLEIKKEGKFFLRAYSTKEDAGNSYDAVLTAFKMNQAIGESNAWNLQYKNLWSNLYNFDDAFEDATGIRFDTISRAYFNDGYQELLKEYQPLLQKYHDSLLNAVNTFTFPRPEPGTAEYDSLFNSIISKNFTEGGSRFFDESALYHIMGEYEFDFLESHFRVGGNYRWYRPYSQGNIFDEIEDIIIETDQFGNEISREYVYREIKNEEFGVYVGIENKFIADKLKTNVTVRMDKNQNFDYLFSPALSAVYDIDEKHTVRVSFGSAIRNPTLADQYLNFNVGRAILRGNITGYDSLISLESFDYYRNQDIPLKKNLDFFNVAPIKPERVRTLEVGYRGSLFKRLYVDFNAYHSWYTDFIGYQFGLELTFNSAFPNRFETLQAYRVSANASELVTTQGVNLGLNYYLTDELTLNGNYSYNAIDLRGSDNPIIPAFNTPKNKFNLGINGRGYKLFNHKENKMGFAINYKWVEGFRFEGSPQFTGFINSYGMLDAQISYQVPYLYSTFKLGASNVLNNEVFQVYGGPTIGRMAYFSIVFEKF